MTPGSGRTGCSGRASSHQCGGFSGDDTLSAAGVSIGDVRMIMDGGEGSDTLLGGTSEETLVGGAGNDTVLGGDGKDTLLGGGGSDIVLGEDDDDSVNGQGGSDTVAGNQGVDVIADPAGEIHETFVLASSIRIILEAL